MQEKQLVEVRTCPTLTSYEATACVSVEVCPFATPGTISIECCGDPIIHDCCDQCYGTANGCCDFTISQSMRVDIPVTFGANVQIGETYVYGGQIDGGDSDGCGCGCDCDCCDADFE